VLPDGAADRILHVHVHTEENSVVQPSLDDKSVIRKNRI
jgi:hypothetical protein